MCVVLKATFYTTMRSATVQKIHFLQNNPKKFRKFLVGLEIPGHGFLYCTAKAEK